MTYDLKRARKLQREVDEAKRTRRIGYVAIGTVVAAGIVPIGMVILGDIFSLDYVRGVGIVIIAFLGFMLFLSFMLGPILMDEVNSVHPFRAVRDAQAKLEDFYDEQGMP